MGPRFKRLYRPWKPFWQPPVKWVFSLDVARCERRGDTWVVLTCVACRDATEDPAGFLLPGVGGWGGVRRYRSRCSGGRNRNGLKKSAVRIYSSPSFGKVSVTVLCTESCWWASICLNNRVSLSVLVTWLCLSINNSYWVLNVWFCNRGIIVWTCSRKRSLRLFSNERHPIRNTHRSFCDIQIWIVPKYAWLG